MRNILERASARTTAPRTLAGALASLVLKELGVSVRSAVDSIGELPQSCPPRKGNGYTPPGRNSGPRWRRMNRP